MKIFLSWSGEASKKIALILREWIPSVIQEVKPYVSSEDIDKGTRWSSDIAIELSESSFGILCVTNENINAPWLNFEAGALSKSLDKAYVIPFLFGIKRAEVKGPIVQFQSTIFEKEDIKKLIYTINSACESKSLDDTRLNKVFEMWWPSLESELSKIELEIPETIIARDQISGVINDSNQAMLEEILDLARSQQKKLSDPHSLFPLDYLSSISNGYSPEAVKDLVNSVEALEFLIEEYSNSEQVPTLKDLQKILESISKPTVYLKRRVRKNLFVNQKSINSFVNE
ncbi:hypothetical protein PTI45_00963 [Paenibacillus nuruki]|uniref:Uncharacterized protein n=1 Tax=Paenibacillus nuruki TaxID=1886670 RepID=A0A1E3L945_9BACL|nr:hypothetical protein PTI45_00963 [Paenibacillus nuruki]